MHWSPIRLLAVVSILAAAGPSVRADDGAKTPGSRKAPFQDSLARLTGSWDAVVTFRINGKDNQGSARCDAKWILNEHAVQQEYSSRFMGAPLTILQLLTYDAAEKKLVEVHLTSLHGGALRNEGTATADGKEWNFRGKTFNLQTGKETTLRTVYKFADDDHFTLEWYMPEADGKEARVVRISHARRK